MLLNSIITQLKSAYHRINANVIGYQKRKEIRSYLHKAKTHYIIESGLYDSGNIQLKVYFNHNKIKLFPFEYCKYKEKYVLFFPKSKIENKTYRVNFILDGQVIINPHYRCEELDGYFVNVINFEEFDQKEREKEIEFKRQIKYYVCYLERNHISLTKEKNDIFDDCAHQFNSSDGKLMQRKGMRSIASSVNTMCNSLEYKSTKMLKKGSGLTRPKSILKMKMFKGQSTNTIKRVSFGNVQFSY